MTEQTITLADTSAVEKKSLTIVDQAKEFLVIKDNEHYTKAGELWKQVVAMMAEVDEGFDKNIKRWHEGHKSALADKARYWNPLNEVKKTIKGAMSKWDEEQERIRQAEQRRLEEIARKAEEERKLQEAIDAEKAGNKEEAAAIIAEPVYVAPVVIPKSVPKMHGGPVYQERWDFEITDVNLIPRQYMQPNTVAIGGVVRSLKGQTNIPGIKAFSKRV